MKLTKFKALMLLLAGGLIFLAGCNKDDDGPEDPPLDSEPLISITDPTSPYVLARTGDVLTIRFEAHDNELLNFFKVTEKQWDYNGTVYSPETQIQNTALSTTDYSQDFIYTVPVTPSYYCTIELRGYAIDNKGRTVSVKFVISVIPPAGSGSDFLMQAYDTPEGDTLWFQYTGHDFNFDIYGHRHGNDVEIPELERHLREETNITGMAPSAVSSPYWQGVDDSVLVRTSTSVFDFDNCTWETIWQAFHSSNSIGTMAGPTLDGGDVVILKLRNSPHFAVFRVLDVETSGSTSGDNYIRFQYKYTYE